MLIPSGSRGQDLDHGRAGGGENVEGGGAGGPVGTVDDQPHPVQPSALERLDHPVAVPGPGIGIGVQLAERLPRQRPRPHPGRQVGLDPLLVGETELAASGREKLDPVVRVGVVRSRDHGRRQVASGGYRGHARRWQHPQVDHINPFARQARGQGRLQQGTRPAGVAPHQERRPAGPARPRPRTRAAARPRARTSSGVSSLPATPRTPSVPNRNDTGALATAWSTAAPCGPS